MTEGQFKAAQNDLRAYLADLLGVDGTVAVALATLKALVNDTVSLSGAYTVTAADRGKVLLASGTWTLALTAASSLGDGFCCAVANVGSGTITIDPNGTETIDGVSTIAIGPGESTLLVCTGTAWRSLFRGGTTKVSSNDTTAGYLNGKLVAGAGIQLQENNDGGDETLTVKSDAAASAVQNGGNVGTGADIFYDKSGTTLRFRRISLVEAGYSSQGIGDIQVAVNGSTLELRIFRYPPGGSGG